MLCCPVAEVPPITEHGYICLGMVHVFPRRCGLLTQVGLTQGKFSVAAIQTDQKFWEHKDG